MQENPNSDKQDSPVFPVNNLMKWYRANSRDLPWRKTDNLYHIWVSEVMLQQTRVDTVIPYYQRFIAAFPTLEHLAAAPAEKVLKIWEGLGYYNRVRNLRKGADMVAREFGGTLPSDPDRIRTIPGIGPYISAALLSIGYRQPVPVVDGNVFRVFTRFFNYREDIAKGKTKQYIFEQLSDIIPGDEPGDFNQAMMELGALVCLPQKPGCGDCPLGMQCRAKALGIQADLPVKSKSAKPPVHRVSLAVLVYDDTFFIQQRSAQGHLGGMWEFPGGKSKNGETPLETVIRECREELGTELTGFTELAKVKHQYTHFGIDVTVFTCRVNEKPEVATELPIRWIRFNEISDYPFPKANHKTFPALKKFMAPYQ